MLIQFILFSYAYYLPFVVLFICNSISENSFLELLETVDKVLFVNRICTNVEL